MSVIRFLLASFLSLISIHSLQAQEPISFSVTYVADEQKNVSALQEMSNSLKASLIDLGYVWSEKSGYIFLLDADTAPSQSGNSTIISITVLSQLPEEIIELGGQGHVFYAAIQKNGIQKMDKGSDEIRAWLSKEYLRQFGMIIDTEILITQDTRSALQAFADTFHKQYSNK